MRRSITAAIAGLSLALLAGASTARAQDHAPLTRPDVERIVHDYLLQNPEVIYQAVQELQRRHDAEEAKRQQVAVDQHKDQIFANSADPVGGNPKGDVTLVEFFDYHCGYCRGMAPQLRALLGQDPKIRFVFKDIPILSPESAVAAKAALAAARQGPGKYQEFHFALMQSKELTREAILDTAGKVGLDTKRLAQDMDDPAIAAKIDQNLKLAEELGINGTPAFVIGDQLIPGATEPARLAELIAQQRQKAGG
jgi:protein-disulfide isomerase